MRVDYLVVSHGESDHYGGLGYIADNLKTREVWTGPLIEDREEGYTCFLALCQRKGIEHRILHAGMDPFTINGVTILILNPVLPENREGVHTGLSGAGDPNNRSLVLQLTYKEITFLFTGDIEREAEGRLANEYGELIASTILNVPHHGSNTSSTEGFLTTVHPCIAVVSAGFGNRFGFPSKAVLDRYSKMGIRLFRTDLDGAIQVKSNGREIAVQSFWGPP
jgi:competence protein ComEC